MRMETLTSGETLLCVAFESAGRLTQPMGRIRFTIPKAAVEGYALMLLSDDGSETALPVTVNRNDTLSFVLDFKPAPGERPSPARVIHLVQQTGK